MADQHLQDCVGHLAAGTVAPMWPQRIHNALLLRNLLRGIITAALAGTLLSAVWPPLAAIGVLLGALLYAGLIFADG